eukprot:3004055-Heterocapsa_arctica.AAC.2
MSVAAQHVHLVQPCALRERVQPDALRTSLPGRIHVANEPLSLAPGRRALAPCGSPALAGVA